MHGFQAGVVDGLDRDESTLRPWSCMLPCVKTSLLAQNEEMLHERFVKAHGCGKICLDSSRASDALAHTVPLSGTTQDPQEHALWQSLCVEVWCVKVQTRSERSVCERSLSNSSKRHSPNPMRRSRQSHPQLQRAKRGRRQWSTERCRQNE
jgi:hypothetical protein